MSNAANGWVQKIAVGVIIGIFLFLFKAQWDATRAMEERLSNHTNEAAATYVPRREFVATLNRLEDTIREAVKDAKNSN